MCSPHVATNAMQPMMAIATQSFNLLFFLTSANCTILSLPRQITFTGGAPKQATAQRQAHHLPHCDVV